MKTTLYEAPDFVRSNDWPSGTVSESLILIQNF